MANYQTITPVKLGQAVLSTTGTLIYTTPASTKTYLKQIDVVNIAVGSKDLDIYIVPSGGTLGTSNAIVFNLPVASHTSYQWRGVQIMNAGDSLRAIASVAASLTLTASGGEAV